MRYRITHRTTYDYASPAYESFNEVRLQPLTDDSQTCLDFGLTIDPPASVIAFRDYYGNAVHDFSVPYLHDRLVIEATSDLLINAALDDYLTAPGVDEVDRSPLLRDLVADELFADTHAEFMTASTYIGLDAASKRIADELLSDQQGLTSYAFFVRAGNAVHERLVYRLGTTTVSSTVAEVLAGGQGVCQDFAHVLISLCRHAGIPARYVSGYLGDAGVAEASHAWAEALIPPYGWVGFDATTGKRCTGRHVKIAVGRDYADVAVVRGTFRGGNAARLEVVVQSEPRESPHTYESMRGAGGARGRGELIQYQSLGAIKQFQRLQAMRHAPASMPFALSNEPGGPGGLSGLTGESEEPSAPRQQPQQQQQR